MLYVVDISSSTTLSCAVTLDSTVLQVLTALKRRRSLVVSDEDGDFDIYAIWNDSKDRIHARKLREEDRPLGLVSHLRRTTGSAPKLMCNKMSTNRARLVFVKANQESLFAEQGIFLEKNNESDFFSILQRLGPGDQCGYLFSNINETLKKKTESSLLWWVLQGETLWFQVSHESNVREYVPLENNKVLGPWSSEFEIQTTLNVYRLIASGASEAKNWVDSLHNRISMSTDNELIALADIMVSDEERSRWKKLEQIMSRTNSLSEWLESSVGINQLIRFARKDRTEYLFLFFLDSRECLVDLSRINPLPLLKRFTSLAALPPSLSSLKNEIQVILEQKPMKSIGEMKEKLLQVVMATKTELEQGMFSRFQEDRKLYERSVSQLPLMFVNENISQ